jgi:hypothetical protein
MTSNDFMTEKSQVHGGDGTLGTVCEEMYLHGKPHIGVKVFYIEASWRDI